MARVLGKAGRYVEDQSVKKTQQYVLCLLILLVALSVAGGALLAVTVYERKILWLTLPVLVLILALLFVAQKLVDKKLDALERERISYRKGAVGEALIAGILEELSDDYVVINDLSTQFGNLDHVVVGPTGVFVIDTKNWKGTVEPDNNEELLLNGSPTTKTEVKNLVRTVMSCREQVINLCRSQRLENDPYVRAVLAFPTAFIKVKWGALKYADCVSDESLVDYIEKNTPKEKLSKKDIDSISHAFELLAQMDRGFDGHL